MTRAWSPDRTADLAKLTLGELDERIAAAEWRFENAANAQLRKSAFKKLTALESARLELHGVASRDRTFPARG